MDTITHILSGVVSARATAPLYARQVPLRRRLGIAAAAAAFPDGDVLISLFADPLTYLNLHRGVTHSLILWPLWAALIGGLFALFWHERERWRDFALIAALAILVHVCGDIITSYGTKILAPFSDYKAAWPITFIIDPIFTGLLLLGLLLSLWLRSALWPSRLALVLLLAYFAAQAHWRGEALEVAEAYAATLPGEPEVVEALPQPLSPRNWKLMLEYEDGYRSAYINLGREQTVQAGDDAGLFIRIDALYRPESELQWSWRSRFGDEQADKVEQLWRHPQLNGFREFARFPVADGVQKGEGEQECVWYTDLRFTLTGIRSPFRYGLCRAGSVDEWRLVQDNSH